MMTLAHAAVGAAIGQAMPNVRSAAITGFVVHGLLDLPEHEDLDMGAEAISTLTALTACLRLFGPRSRQFWGAFSCAAPDLEHVFLRSRHTRLFPTHRFPVLHNLLPTPRLTARTQIALSAATLALVARRARVL